MPRRAATWPRHAEHRAQLAQVLQDLDRAYYRLERTNAALVAAWRCRRGQRLKSELATNLSHELRTPLNLIIGFCEMVGIPRPEKYGSVAIPGVYRSDLNAIYQNAQHLMALVNDVLDLARIDYGRLGLAREEVHVANLVREAVDMVREYVEAKGLQLVIVMAPDDLPSLWIDRLRVRQVLLNLLVNAARFTEQGSVRVGVAGEEVVLSVEDTGRGIPAAELDHVFEEFTQVGPHQAQGWPSVPGLGLPISKKAGRVARWPRGRAL